MKKYVFYKTLAIITLLFVSGIFTLGKAQIPVKIKCENNAKTDVEIRVQITSPDGVIKVWEEKELKDKLLNYSIVGPGEVGVFVQYKENKVKSPTFIKKSFMVTGDEEGIAILTSINLKGMTILCDNEYSNRRYCVLDIRKYYPEKMDGGLPAGCENITERTAIWNYSISSIQLRK